MALKKEEYYQLTNLYIKQDWLLKKKDELIELIEFCDDVDSKKVVFSLLERFNYLSHETLSYILDGISNYIVEESGFNEDTTQILAMSMDSQADSGQKILDYIKHPLYKKGWRQLRTVNIFSKSVKNYNDGKTQIIIVDEFIGSGKTLRGRIKHLQNNIKGNYEVKCCFVAGMRDAIALLESEGIEIFCPLQLDKGVSGYFKDAELSKVEKIMLNLESKLAQKINEKELSDYSFGYGEAEALYSLEGCNGNTPNSVFPIFWWLMDKNNKMRNTVLTRVESGF